MAITPCVGICSTVYGDDVCRGCKRHFTEVINWNALTDDERDECWARLNRLAFESLDGVISLVDEDKFKAALDLHRIRQKPGHEWAFQAILLLRQSQEFINDLSECGLATTSDLPLEKLMIQVDDIYYAASQAEFN